MDYTIVSGKKPSSVALHQNHAKSIYRNALSLKVWERNEKEKNSFSFCNILFYTICVVPALLAVIIFVKSESRYIYLSWTSDWFVQWFRGFHIQTCMAGSIQSRLWHHVFMTKRLWRHVLITSNFSCFGGFYFVFALYRFKKKFMSPILCSI